MKKPHYRKRRNICESLYDDERQSVRFSSNRKKKSFEKQRGNAATERERGCKIWSMKMKKYMMRITIYDNDKRTFGDYIISWHFVCSKIVRLKCIQYFLFMCVVIYLIDVMCRGHICGILVLFNFFFKF